MVPKNFHITARHVLYCASAAENLAVFAALDMVTEGSCWGLMRVSEWLVCFSVVNRNDTCALGAFSTTAVVVNGRRGDIDAWAMGELKPLSSASLPSMAQYNPNNFQDRYMDLREPVRQAMIR